MYVIGSKNQKLADPHNIENGVKPKRGINVLGLFSEKLFLFQLEGCLYIL